MKKKKNDNLVQNNIKKFKIHKCQFYLPVYPDDEVFIISY